jgi:solute carrier family 41
MQEVDQLIMIIPVVLNLNGNLEMNLSARLATAANIGEFDDLIVRRSMIIGSLALLQVQTASVSFVAACIALILGRFVPRTGPSASPSSSVPTNSTTLALRNILSYPIQPRQTALTLSIVDQGRKSGIKTSVCPPPISLVKFSYSRLSG